MKQRFFLLAATLCLAMTLAACGRSAGGGTDAVMPVPLPTPAAETAPPEAAPGDRRPMVMVDGALYLDTGESDLQARCGVVDGEITTSVDASTLPTQDDESNFGAGYGYQVISETEIDVNLDGRWVRFRREEAETVTYNGVTHDRADLSQETLAWLDRYNGLSEEEQCAAEDIPAELLVMCEGLPLAPTPMVEGGA